MYIQARAESCSLKKSGIHDILHVVNLEMIILFQDCHITAYVSGKSMPFFVNSRRLLAHSHKGRNHYRYTALFAYRKASIYNSSGSV